MFQALRAYSRSLRGDDVGQKVALRGGRRQADRRAIRQKGETVFQALRAGVHKNVVAFLFPAEPEALVAVGAQANRGREGAESRPMANTTRVCQVNDFWRHHLSDTTQHAQDNPTQQTITEHNAPHHTTPQPSAQHTNTTWPTTLDNINLKHGSVFLGACRRRPSSMLAPGRRGIFWPKLTAYSSCQH